MVSLLLSLSTIIIIIIVGVCRSFYLRLSINSLNILYIMGFLKKILGKSSNKYVFTDADRDISLKKRQLGYDRAKRADNLEALTQVKDVFQVLADIDNAKNELLQNALQNQQTEVGASEDMEFLGLIREFLQSKREQPQPIDQPIAPLTPVSPVDTIISNLPEVVVKKIAAGKINKKTFDKYAAEEAKKLTDAVFDKITGSTPKE